MKAQSYLETKSKMGVLLCKSFIHILNNIVERMVTEIQSNIGQLEGKIFKQLKA